MAHIAPIGLSLRSSETRYGVGWPGGTQPGGAGATPVLVTAAPAGIAAAVAGAEPEGVLRRRLSREEDGLPSAERPFAR